MRGSFGPLRGLTAAAGLLLGFLVSLALLAPWLPLQDPNETRLTARLQPPGLRKGDTWDHAAPSRPDPSGPTSTTRHVLGTDLLGRDILARLIWGLRLSLLAGGAATVVAALLGALIGLVAGQAGGRVDTLLMRGIDLIMAFPHLLLALAIVAILGPGLLNALIAISIVNIPFFARTVRGVTLGLVRQDFVTTARLSGRSAIGVLLCELLPNVFPILMITTTSTLGWMILETAGLSFLGLGAQPPTADLGSMLGEGRKLMWVHPHVALLPGAVVLLLVMSINLLGDGLRDLLDPRERGLGQGRPSVATQVSRGSFAASTAIPGTASPPAGTPEVLLEVRKLSIEFRLGRRTLRAVRDLSFELRRGETLGLVGESGSGKSATALALLRLLPSPPAVVTSGSVCFQGTQLLSLKPSQLQGIRGNRIAFVFQDPSTTLNPMHPVGAQIAEGIRQHRALSRRDAWKEAVAWMERLRIPDAPNRARSCPHQLSGGMRQRISIAMALANHPDILIADEPTTALDVTVQRLVTDLLRERLSAGNTALLFISHDLALVSELCERLMVLYAGQVLESGPTQKILANPAHPYTSALLNCTPSVGRDTELRPIPGHPPDPAWPPVGCPFADRCAEVQPDCRLPQLPRIQLGERAHRCRYPLI